MNKHVLFAAVAATLFAAPVHAIKINDQAVTANGGNKADIQGTAPNVFDSLRTASMASQFDAVGRIGDCTGTWLGTDGEYAWVLTAARCVRNTNLVGAADHLTFTNKNGVALAGGEGSTSYIHPKRINRPSGVRDAGTDIALVRLKRLPASNTQAPVSPVIYDGKSETGTPVSFVAYGSAFANNANVNAVWPTSGERRAWGESNLDGATENSHALFANYTTGSALRWSGLTTSDAGSAWWQERNGQWQIVATTSGGSAVQSHGARVSTYATWINDLFPGAMLSSEEMPTAEDVELTETMGHNSINFGRAISLIKVPGQPELGASATAITVANEAALPRTITLPLTNGKTTTPVVLRAWRQTTGGCPNLTIHNNSNCGQSEVSTFHFRYVASDNPGLLPGTWTGRIVFDARHWQGAIVGRAEIDIAIKVAGNIAPGFEFSTKNYGVYATSPNVYYSVPTQPTAVGPTAGHMNSTLGHSVITVQARDAVTSTLTSLKLRAQRDNGCNLIAMNNAQMCNGQVVSKLKVWFDPSDNPSLQPSRYRAQFNVQARGWHDKAFNQTFPIDVDVNLLP